VGSSIEAKSTKGIKDGDVKIISIYEDAPVVLHHVKDGVGLKSLTISLNLWDLNKSNNFLWYVDNVKDESFDVSSSNKFELSLIL
jgi:hypothetical protein